MSEKTSNAEGKAPQSEEIPENLPAEAAAAAAEQASAEPEPEPEETSASAADPSSIGITPDSTLSDETATKAVPQARSDTILDPQFALESITPAVRMDSAVEDTVAVENALEPSITAPENAAEGTLPEGEAQTDDGEPASAAETATEYPTVVPPPSDRVKSPAPFAGFLAEHKDPDPNDDEDAGENSDEKSGEEEQNSGEEKEPPSGPVGIAPSLRVTIESSLDIPLSDDPNQLTSPPAPTSAYQRSRQAQTTDEVPGRGRRYSSTSGVGRRRPLRIQTSGENPSSSSELKLGAYRVIGELGSGGMAVIYKAVQTAVDRMVAIKELRPELISDKEVMARFEREATSMASLQHGNIVQIYDFVHDFDSAYIVMEYVEGIDLFDVLAHCQKVPLDVVAILGLKVASALEYAHYRGIIHRDIKPSNFLMSNVGEIKLLDFGIARDPGRSNITQIGMALGTPAYMSPEQIRGEKIDFRADIFSLGVCLYEFMAGEKPWMDDGTQEVARKILIEPPRPIRQYCPEISFEMESIISRCLAKDANYRFESTFELSRALQEVVVKELAIDPRQRLVVFLNNHKLVSAERAASVVAPETLKHPGLRRRDLGYAQPSADPLFRQTFLVCTAGLFAVFCIAFISGFLPWGESIAEQPTAVALKIAAPIPAKSATTSKETKTVVPAATKKQKPKRVKKPTRKPRLTPVKKTKRKAAAAAPGSIRVTGSKKWFDVYVNGRKLYRHPKRSKPLAPGKYLIQLKNPTCKTIRRRVIVRSRQMTTIKANCIPNT